MKLPLAAGVFLALVATLLALSNAAAEPVLRTFKRIQLSDQFWCEGANFSDFNRDGANDIVAGPWWWQGPGLQIETRDLSCDEDVQAAAG